ncbi:hypothetical protein [Limnohabitans lacus]|uniref:Uncharacterized protein n=1 Tax=Limnohabitans lacus TaxID=3045173 RepID=A0ABT6X6F8_9BURK|nr:hypothetical protein [Limnohabitans sp. HM2-2]MDI9233710.1 hypothetical protein [Limnohabitans sp. HM2-2]
MNAVKEEQQKSVAREKIEHEYIDYCLSCLQYQDYCQFSMLSRKIGGLEGFLNLCDEHNITAPIAELKKWVAWVFDLHAEQQSEARRMGF